MRKGGKRRPLSANCKAERLTLAVSGSSFVHGRVRDIHATILRHVGRANEDVRKSLAKISPLEEIPRKNKESPF